ncbi:MAG: precorrin-2 C(20)-methyltransferase [Desulfovibrio sp.]|jgi:precorrin-2/cobalt-factor-2 C20-methyltransferase|nr:precorrin-2 C(20)-methyltransferase [Desulfovibrio sp.]
MTTTGAKGTLYGVGVGPGAPDLLTLRAVEVLGRVRAILAAASPNNDHSMALEVARPHLKAGIEIVRLDFPMTRDRERLETAWRLAAQKALEVLESLGDAAFLTLGDPLIYSTFGYLMRRIEETAPGTPIEIVPGITSFQAAAARVPMILCEGEESLRILSGIGGEEALLGELEGDATAVVLKAYRNCPAILKALERSGRRGTAVMASRVEQPGETLAPCADMDGSTPPYMTLILSPGTRERS